MHIHHDPAIDLADRQCKQSCVSVHFGIVAMAASYSATTSLSVNSMAQTSAYQLRKSDIRVNSICPGLIETSMTADTFTSARERGRLGKVGQLNALGRFGVAEGHPHSTQHFVTHLTNNHRDCERCVIPGKRYGTDVIPFIYSNERNRRIELRQWTDPCCRWRSFLVSSRGVSENGLNQIRVFIYENCCLSYPARLRASLYKCG